MLKLLENRQKRGFFLISLLMGGKNPHVFFPAGNVRFFDIFGIVSGAGFLGYNSPGKQSET